ncbi:MAG: YraN family protein [Lachnospiraceae bacterium]|nr:YraN family protein [Lachnospiraceae bacterium]
MDWKAENKKSGSGRKKYNRRSIGACYEQQAVIYLEELGYRVIEHNYYCHLGEIDLIARDGAYLVFLEVKYRAGSSFGSAAEAVTVWKQRRICQCAAVYMKQHGILFDHPVRFDVLAVDGNQVTLIKNAFGGI